jgi:hypothetical protein
MFSARQEQGLTIFSARQEPGPTSYDNFSCMTDIQDTLPTTFNFHGFHFEFLREDDD